MLSFRQYHLHQLFAILSQESGPLDLIISRYFRQNRALGSKDRKTIAETLYDMMRNIGLLDFFIEGKKSWESRYEIYQEINLQECYQNNAIPLHVRLSFPQNILDRWISSYGIEKATKLAKLSNLRAPITLRVNASKISRDDFLEQFKDEIEMRPCQASPCAVHVLKRISLFQHPAFSKGYFEMQDEASQMISSLIEASPKQKVLDFCAGSGGKSLAIAPQMEGSGVLYLHDIRPGILRQAKKRLKRAGIQNAQIVQYGSKSLKPLRGNMDWVLVDAPCSGSGTYRRNPDLKWKFTEEMLSELIESQRAIFSEALQYLKPKGKIVFATCSLFEEENEKQVEYFLTNHPIELASPPFSSIDLLTEMDGFFGATFKLK